MAKGLPGILSASADSAAGLADVKRMAPSPRSRTRGWRTLTGPIPVWMKRSSRYPLRTTRRRPAASTSVACATQNHGDLGLNGLKPTTRELQLVGLPSTDQRLKIRWVLKSNNGILFHGVSFLGLAQVETSTITRIRRLHFNAVHKIRRGGKKSTSVVSALYFSTAYKSVIGLIWTFYRPVKIRL